MRIAVIGAGASGFAAAIKLKEAGVEDFVVFEKAATLGGTWRDNTYPGVACDVPSHLYRYSFAPKSDWSMEYAPGAEICAYLHDVAEQFGILANIRFETALTRAEFAAGKWRLSSSRGDEGLFDAVISAMGVLHKEVFPAIAGREDFAGAAFHSSKWRHDIALEGKRVGIIGTGSTAVQILPEIVDRVAKVTLFQRTPQWVFPVANRPIPEAKKRTFADEPDRLRELYAFLGDRLNRRLAAALIGQNAEGLLEITEGCRRNLEENVTDPALRAKLTPDYAVGCKRLVVSDRFYPALQKPAAELVVEGIERILPSGVLTVDGVEHGCDVIVYATGFDAFNFHRPMKVIGPDGRDLDDEWAESSHAFRSVMTPGFPNFFFIGGPNSPIGNFSFLLTAEAQIAYAIGLIELIRDGVHHQIEPKVDVARRFNQEIQDAMSGTIWVTGGCSSWYFDPSGKVASWPWSYERFESDLRAPDPDEYRLA